MWNKTIRSISLSYLELSVQFLVLCKLGGNLGEKVTLGIFLVGWPILTIVVLVRNRDHLEDLRP